MEINTLTIALDHSKAFPFKQLVKGIHDSAKIGNELMIEVANPWKLGTSWMLLRLSQHMMASRDVQRPTET